MSTDERDSKVSKRDGRENGNRPEDHPATGGVVQLLQPGEGLFTGCRETGPLAPGSVVENHFKTALKEKRANNRDWCVCVRVWYSMRGMV